MKPASLAGRSHPASKKNRSMGYPYNKETVEHRQHINRGERALLRTWRLCPVFDAFSKALMDDLAEWRRIRAKEAAMPPDSWSWDDD
jgi:hypothetical protein